MKPEKQIHPIVRGAVSGAAFIFASLLANFVLPAWAVSFPVGNLFVVDLGALTPWIGIAVTLGIWWDARKAKNAAEAVKTDLVVVKGDVKLLERNTNSISSRNEEIARKLGISEGEEKQKLASVETAKVLVEGERLGMEKERASVAAAAKAPVPAPATLAAASGDTPVPVVDDVAGGAAVKSATALESLASSAKKTAEDK